MFISINAGFRLNFNNKFRNLFVAMKEVKPGHVLEFQVVSHAWGLGVELEKTKTHNHTCLTIHLVKLEFMFSHYTTYDPMDGVKSPYGAR